MKKRDIERYKDMGKGGFEGDAKRDAKMAAGNHCMICNHGGDEKAVDVHSYDKSHRHGTAMVTCRVQKPRCHQKIHAVAFTPVEVRRVSLTAARLGGLDLATRLVRAGMPEEEIREILNRRPY